jgi:hypothetical protein
MDNHTPPTTGQLKVIYFIEKNLEVKFDGQSILDAREFISEHIEKSKEASIEHKSFIRMQNSMDSTGYNPEVKTRSTERNNDRIKREDKQEFMDRCFGSKNNSQFIPHDEDDFRPF